MSVLLGNELTEELFRRLNGDDINQHLGKAVILVTVDHQEWAHPAMLSYHEVVAKSRSQIDLAVGKTSTTARNLKRTGRITLLLADRSINYYLKGSVREIKESMDGIPFMSLFRMELTQLLEDQEPDAVITSGVTFTRPEKASAVAEKIFHGLRRGP